MNVTVWYTVRPPRGVTDERTGKKLSCEIRRVRVMVASPLLAWEYLVRISAHLLIGYKENKHLGIELNLGWLSCKKFLS